MVENWSKCRFFADFGPKNRKTRKITEKNTDFHFFEHLFQALSLELK